MLKFACRPGAELQDIFRRAGARRAIGPHIMEKDFWVCWLLRLLFMDKELGNQMVFKGGTSLSKVFAVIQRFSEDIDLSVRPAWLGFEGEKRPDAASSGSQFEKRSKALETACADMIRRNVMPKLAGLIAENLPGVESASLSFEIDAHTHSPVLLFSYPRTGRIPGALRQQVKLEFGSLYDQRPTGSHNIVPWVAEIFPDLFADRSCAVVALEAERTFWEKATLLHAEYHRPAGKPMTTGLSRHYYDMCCLAKNALGERALADRMLLDKVRKHKQTYFKSAWAHYETAVPGSFHITPAAQRVNEIERDYRDMGDMFLAPPPAFGVIIQALKELETRINAA